MIGFGTKVLSLLEEASYSTTASSPSCWRSSTRLVNPSRKRAGHPGVSTTAVAERVLELYWPQSAPFPERRRSASSSRAVEARQRSFLA